jgi:hypothetical protein
VTGPDEVPWPASAAGRHRCGAAWAGATISGAPSRHPGIREAFVNRPITNQSSALSNEDGPLRPALVEPPDMKTQDPGPETLQAASRRRE